MVQTIYTFVLSPVLVDVPDIVVQEEVEGERPNILKQSSSSIEIAEITDKINAESNQQFRPLREVIKGKLISIS